MSEDPATIVSRRAQYGKRVGHSRTRDPAWSRILTAFQGEIEPFRPTIL
jgi:hypothetical protein